MKTLVLGLGNPILTDDGVGIHVVRELSVRKSALGVRPDVTFGEASVGGFRLLELLESFERAILVDAIQTPEGRPGDISRLGVRDLHTSRHSGSSHDLTLAGALTLGRHLGMPLPMDEDIVIIAVEADDVLTFGEQCTPAVQAAIEPAVQRVVEEIATGE